MHDEMDEFLGCRLKNWVAEYPIPPNDKRRLLRAATAQRAQENWQPDEPPTLLRRIFPAQIPYPFHGECLPVPFTQSHLWSLQLATTFRLAI